MTTNLDPGKRMDSIEGRVERIEVDLGRLTGTIAGDGTELSPGVVGLLSRHARKLDAQEGRIERMESTIARAKWTLGTAAALGSSLGGGIVFAMTQLIGGP